MRPPIPSTPHRPRRVCVPPSCARSLRGRSLRCRLRARRPAGKQLPHRPWPTSSQSPNQRESKSTATVKPVAPPKTTGSIQPPTKTEPQVEAKPAVRIDPAVGRAFDTFVSDTKMAEQRAATSSPLRSPNATAGRGIAAILPHRPNHPKQQSRRHPSQQARRGNIASTSPTQPPKQRLPGRRRRCRRSPRISRSASRGSMRRLRNSSAGSRDATSS